MNARINPERVCFLRDHRHFTFRRIGEVLADEVRRPIRFDQHSIAKVYYAEKRRLAAS